MALRDVLASVETMTERLRRVVAVHFDPEGGSAFWLDRAAALGVDALRDVRCIEDLARLGEMGLADLRERPLWDYVPRRFHRRLDRVVVGQGGGGVSPGTWTAYRIDEFEVAFVLPFVSAAGHVGFPPRAVWLYIGPGGPHLAGKVAQHLANALGSPDPFTVDFDPRWARRLPDGSFGRRRYVQHVLDQALDIVRGQRVEVLFSTAGLLRLLGESMAREHRERIRGIHYAGAGVTQAELACLQQELFPHAVHLSGYGNAMFGKCLEICTAPGRRPTHFPYGNRLILEAVDDDGTPLPPGQTGRLCYTRLDETMLIVRCIERNKAVSVAVPSGAPEGFEMPGLQAAFGPAESAPART